MTRLPQRDFWNGREVFLTGHQGFKGAWMTFLLSRLGARTVGYGRDHRTPLLYRELEIGEHTNIEGDINDLEPLNAALSGSSAEILVHLAAQPIVLTSYADPIGTFNDNVLGTARVLEAARHAPNLKAIVVVTSDKVYRNNEWSWPYRETDALGGADPYSASKAAAEIVTASMMQSFFSQDDAPAVASARAGNVIGGGDWADYRLLPDAARALSRDEPLRVRNPNSTRPWQHVLEPLVGYLLLAEDLHAKGRLVSPAWNFGPVADDAIPVHQVADIFVSTWGGGASWQSTAPAGDAPKEASFLAVDASLARRELDWTPRWRVDEAVSRTAAWYRSYFEGVRAEELLDRDIHDYLEGGRA